MKLDVTKLPIAEMVMGFFVVVLAVTFVGAFSAVNGGSSDNAAGASPSAAASGTPGASPSAAASGTPGASATPAPSGGGALAVAMHDNSFDPKEFTVQAGSKVTFDITNSGSATHNMHIAGDGNKYADPLCKVATNGCSDPNTVPGGATATLEWQAPATAGTVNFRCDFHLQEMTGTITVQ
jgi:plastocyanin